MKLDLYPLRNNLCCLIINDDEYPDMYDASSSTPLKVKDMLQNYGESYEEYNIRPAIDTSHITKDRPLPFKMDKKLANKMYLKITEIKGSHYMLQLFNIKS